MRSIHALLVGIDRYAGDVPELSGCANDIRAVEQLLGGIAADDVQVPEPLRLLDEQATRDAVVAGFRDHLTAAGPGDVALFWYSGHGAQQATTPEFAAAEPDGLDETLVCHDSRAGSWDLTDKELAGLVAQVSAGGAHVLVVLDCCHSGSGVRALDEGGVAVRRAPTDRRLRPADSYLFRSTAGTGTREIGGWDLGGEAAYVLLAACRSDQTAKETRIDGQVRGAFSAALQAAITHTGGRLSYADLVAFTGTQIATTVRAQDPQLECTDPADAHRSFLAGTVAPARTSYRMLFDGTDWFLNAGAVHGIPEPRGTETVLLSTQPATGTEPTGVTARVVAVQADRSVVELDGPLDQGVVYRATVAAWPLHRLTVELTGPAEALAPVRAALAGSRLTEQRDADPDVTVEATPAGYRVGSPRGGLRLAHTVDGHGSEAVTAVATAVERIARWRLLRELSNPTSGLAPAELQIEIGTGPGSTGPADTSGAGPVHLVYGTDGNGNEQTPGITVRVRNGTQRTLFVAILILDEEHEVANTLGAAPGEWVKPGAVLDAVGGRRMEVEIPDHLYRDGVTEITDWIKVIACTEQFDVAELLQSGLSASVVRRALEGNVLDQLFARATRKINIAPADVAADWQTATRMITVERPGAGIPLRPGGPTDLGSGLTLSAPAGFTGRARLTSVDTTTRDLGAAAVPPLLRDPAWSRPLTLVPHRGESDVSVLEIDVETGAAQVAPDSPLVLTLPFGLADDEHVLAVAHDGEYWLPVGRVRDRGAPGTSGTASVVIEQLPAARASDRGLWTSVRILFRKLAGRALGLRYEHPVLAAATVADGKVEYDTGGVAALVAAARSPLLLVHGIIGDTRGLVEFAGRAGDRHDLLLTFDYESIHTTVEENARELRRRLTELGFGPGRQVDVVAHSMGGLVLRWMVEQEGGAPLVRRAVLAGTPHAGSPWPTIQGWATTALGLALNGLSATIWPAAVIGALVQAVEQVDNALDELEPGSELLARLDAAADPAVPYTLVVGENCTVDPTGRIAGLLHRLRPRTLLDPVAALAFLGHPNDLVVSTVSAGAVPGPRAPAVVTVRVPCDHLTYFSSDTGGTAVDEALK